MKNSENLQPYNSFMNCSGNTNLKRGTANTNNNAICTSGITLSSVHTTRKK